MIRLIITGPRACTKNNAVISEISEYITQLGGVDEIITGGASGVDMMAKQYAREHAISYREFIPNWQNDLNAAGMIRDTRMAEYATHLLVFVTEGTKESQNLMDEAQRNHLRIRMITPREKGMVRGERPILLSPSGV